MDGWNGEERWQITIEEGESITIQIVQAVAACADERPTDLPPLRDVLDPDALESLYSSLSNEFDRPVGMVRFSYVGFRIIVLGDGSLVIESSHPAVEHEE